MASNALRSVQRRLGARIHALRKDRALTQEALAQRSGISQKYLSELERGEKSPSWETLVSLAHDGLGVRLASLMFGIDEEVGAEPRQLDDVLAGRPAAARYEVLRAVQLLLKAGETTK